jgi:hypothetical protein
MKYIRMDYAPYDIKWDAIIPCEKIKMKRLIKIFDLSTPTGLDDALRFVDEDGVEYSIPYTAKSFVRVKIYLFYGQGLGIDETTPEKEKFLKSKNKSFIKWIEKQVK